MSSTSAIAANTRAVEMMAEVLMNAVVQTTEMAEKMVAVNVETALGVTEGLGEIIDIQG